MTVTTLDRAPLQDNLTESDARARAALLSNLSYEVSLSLSDDPHAETFQSTTTVVFDAAHEGSETFINIAARSIDECTLNGKRLTAALHWKLDEETNAAVDVEILQAVDEVLDPIVLEDVALAVSDRKVDMLVAVLRDLQDRRDQQIGARVVEIAAPALRLDDYLAVARNAVLSRQPGRAVPAEG